MEYKPLPWFVGTAGQDALQRADNYIVLDVENTTLPGFATNPDNHLVLACWYVVKNGVVKRRHLFGDEYSMDALARDVAAADFIVAHNAKYECQWLQRMGIDLRGVLTFCTMVGEWLIAGNKKQAFDLDSIAAVRLNDKKGQLGKSLIRDWGVCPSVTPESWLLRYCYKDVYLTYKVFLQQHAELTVLNMWHLVLSRNLVVPVLADMELQGLQLDADEVDREYRKQLDIREAAALALDEITEGINLGSGPQVSKLLYDKLGFAEVRDFAGNLVRTQAGARSTAAATILALKAETKDQQLFLDRYTEWNKADTLISKTLQFLQNVCLYNGGVFYGNILQGRVGTHRLASAGQPIKFPDTKKEMRIQLQNIPRQYKKMFTAHDPDYLIMEGDGAQLEFRVGAEMGGDKQAIYDIENGVDIHSNTREAYRAAKHPAFEGLDDKAGRQEAKARTFAPMYGGRGQHPADHAYADFWKEKYPDLYRTQDNWCLRVAADKQLVTPYGMRFYWPQAALYSNGRVNVRTEVFNYPIQGFATAEIIPIALVHFWHRSVGLRVQIFNTVHDSIIVRVHKDDVAAAEAIMKQALTADVYQFLDEVYDYQFKVPLGVGMKTAKHWGAGKTEKVWDVWPDGRERYQEKD